MTIKVAVVGACGRMAGQVARRVNEDDNLELVAAIDSNTNPNIGRDIGEVLGIGKTGILVTKAKDLADTLNNANPDVLVEFTAPEATVENVKIAASKGVNILVGTTGLNETQKKEIIDAVEKNKVAGMISANFSVCVNLFFKLIEKAAKVLSDYDVEIIEAHHRFKKDAPSGTAMKLAEVIADARGVDLGKSAVYGRSGITGERKSDEIGIHAIRAGDIAGDHTVLFGTIGERMELKYQAHSRDAFATGCIKAIKWIANKETGMYDMYDVLGLN